MENVSRLPQLQGRPMVTDGGMETDFIFHHGVDLPHFAAFPLLDTAEGRKLLKTYYDGYATIAADAGTGLLLESPTWRASADWGALLGYSAADLARINAAAITMLADLRSGYSSVDAVVVSGVVGPRGDGYRPGDPVESEAAAEYHAPQVEAFAQAGADLVTAYTLTGTNEAIGIVQASRAAGLPVAISFTVEIDGRLPDGTGLQQAIEEVDAAARPDYFLVNCAHPTHVAAGLGLGKAGLDEPDLGGPGLGVSGVGVSGVGAVGGWRDRIVGLRCNASTSSHAELDEATELDEGDPQEFATTHGLVRPLLPRLSIVGGCCGTDARHVAALWHTAH